MWELRAIDDQAHHDLTGCKSYPRQDMAHQTSMCLLIIGGNIIFLQEIPHTPDNRIIALRLNIAMRRVNDRMRSACIKSYYDLSILIPSHRKLRFVPVIPRIFHADDRLHQSFRMLDSTDTRKTVLNFVPFVIKLFFVAHMLQGTASAWSCHRAFRFYAIW